MLRSGRKAKNIIRASQLVRLQIWLQSFLELRANRGLWSVEIVLCLKLIKQTLRQDIILSVWTLYECSKSLERLSSWRFYQTERSSVASIIISHWLDCISKDLSVLFPFHFSYPVKYLSINSLGAAEVKKRCSWKLWWHHRGLFLSIDRAPPYLKTTLKMWPGQFKSHIMWT